MIGHRLIAAAAAIPLQSVKYCPWNAAVPRDRARKPGRDSVRPRRSSSTIHA